MIIRMNTKVARLILYLYKAMIKREIGIILEFILIWNNVLISIVVLRNVHVRTMRERLLWRSEAYRHSRVPTVKKKIA